MKLILEKEEWLEINGKLDLRTILLFSHYVGNEDKTFVIKDRYGKVTHTPEGEPIDEKSKNID